MRILLVSKFLHHVGGVETYLRWLADSLPTRGHEVAVLGMPPMYGGREVAAANKQFHTKVRQFTEGPLWERVQSASASVYSWQAGSVMRRAMAAYRPDVVHFHNISYQLTSSVVRAAASVPKVLTLHDHKLVCANQRLWDDRKDALCEACVGKRGLRRSITVVGRGCIKADRLASAVGAAEEIVSRRIIASAPGLLVHAPSRYLGSMVQRDGWDMRRVVHVELPWDSDIPLAPQNSRRPFRILYMGRLSPEKDVATLIRAWKGTNQFGLVLTVAGDGPQSAALRRMVLEQQVGRVEFMGKVDRAELSRLLGESLLSVHPAGCAENSPFAVRESLLSGVPALVASSGGMPELIDTGLSGVVVEHTEASWLSVLRAAKDVRLLRGPALRAHVMRTRPGPAQHLTQLEKLYASADRRC